MVILSVFLLGVSPILLALSFGVRMAKSSPILNFVDYSGLADPAGFNRYAGTRLFILPIMAITFGLIGLNKPSMGFVLLIGFVATALVLAAWILIGSGQFQKPLKANNAKN